MFKNLEVILGLSAGMIDKVIHTKDDLRYEKVQIKKNAWYAPDANSQSRLRTVYVPSHELKVIQRKVANIISRRFVAHDVAHAYATGRSTITNAQRHIGNASLLRVDLVNFFGSIAIASVKDAFGPVFAECSGSEVEALASLCCYKGFLPQGSPASPIISNLVCWPLDDKLEKLANKLDCTVTRYSDDIYFSSKCPCFPDELINLNNGSIIVGNELQSLVDQFSFQINKKKLRLQFHPQPLHVTGIIVGSKLVVPSELRKNIRASLHRWKSYGILYAASSLSRSRDISKFLLSLSGRISYVGQVAGRDSLQYQNLAVPFAKLLARDRKSIET